MNWKPSLILCVATRLSCARFLEDLFTLSQYRRSNNIPLDQPIFALQQTMPHVANTLSDVRRIRPHEALYVAAMDVMIMFLTNAVQDYRLADLLAEGVVPPPAPGTATKRIDLNYWYSLRLSAMNRMMNHGIKYRNIQDVDIDLVKFYQQVTLQTRWAKNFAEYSIESLERYYDEMNEVCAKLSTYLRTHSERADGNPYNCFLNTIQSRDKKNTKRLFVLGRCVLEFTDVYVTVYIQKLTMDPYWEHYFIVGLKPTGLREHIFEYDITPVDYIRLAAPGDSNHIGIVLEKPKFQANFNNASSSSFPSSTPHGRTNR